MRALRATALLATALAASACATPPGVVPGVPHEVRAHPLPPYEIHEECVRLVPGDRLHWRFEAKAPLAFAIQYREGRTVVLPVTREQAIADEGTFAPQVAQDYCLTWEAGAEGTPLDYTVRLVRGPAR